MSLSSSRSPGEKGRRTILLLCLSAGAAFWIADSILEYFVVSSRPFIDIFLADIEPQKLYVRCIVFASYMVFAVMISKAYSRRKRLEIELMAANEQHAAGQQQLRASNQQLEASQQQLRASNQQLAASNQQLRATDQQLRASEAALRRERDRAQEYLDVAGVMLIVIDADGRVRMINRKGCEILAATESEVVGKNWFETYLPARSKELAYNLFERLLADDTKFAEYAENEIITKDGDERTIAWHNSLLSDEGGRIVAVLSSGTDITGKKRTEHQLRQMESRLARAERLEALGVLAGGVAHDLNNILIPMVAMPDLILDEVDELAGDQDISELRTDIVSIQRAGKTAADVVRDLLTLSRRGHYDKRALHLNEAIASYMSSVNFSHIRLENPDVEVHTDLDPTLFPILGSETHLTQVMMNLIINAVESMPHGGRLDIKTTNTYVDASLINYEVIGEGEYVTLQISDSGAGINDEDLDKIFEPFYTKKKMGRRSGTGLGLSVVYGVVKDHDGYIDIETEIGTGTTFTLYFPITRDKVSNEKDVIAVTGGTETILVVDDVPAQLEVARRLLGRLGYTIKTADNGTEAVEMVSEARESNGESPFDLMLLDMIMEEGFDGLDTYREILKSFPSQKCIVVSGFAETDRVRETQDIGAGGFLAKPYTMERLASAVRRALDHS